MPQDPPSECTDWTSYVAGDRRGVRSPEIRHDEPAATRVRVQSIGAGQSVTVQVIDPGPMTSGERWRAGQTVKTTSRKLTCRYADWSAVAAQTRQRRAEQQAAWREREEAREYAATPDPDRGLPAA